MKKIVAISWVILLFTCCVQQEHRILDSQKSLGGVKTYTVLQEWGGRVSWLHQENMIAFDRPGADGFSDIYTMSLDSTDTTCLTCDKPVPQFHNGNPSWHPSGNYIVFQAQDPNLKGLPSTPAGNYIASPGIGINNNLWVMTADGSQFWQLTHVKNRYGVLHPHFSPDGTQLVWSETISPCMDRIGHWAIKLADFAFRDGEPSLTNVQTLQPGNLQLYELHEFSPDGKILLFSGIEQGEYYYDMEIYTLDLTSHSLIKLTDNEEWDEHAHFTPDGDYIIWVSSATIFQPRGDSLEDIIETPPKLEYWIMRADGSDKCRLSGFNLPDAVEYFNIPGGVGLGDFDIGGDAGTIVAKMRQGHNKEVTVFIEFDLALCEIYH